MAKDYFLSLVATVALCLGCSTPPPQSFSDEMQPILAHGDGRVGTYVSSELGFTTSSYWIEGPTGLIFIDTQFLLSAGKEAVEWAEKLTGKKVVLAIVLHPNPDKFNGVGELQKRGVRVVTSDQIRHMIPEVHRDRHYWFYKRYAPDYPDVVPLPDSFGNQTTELTAGGVTITAHVLRGPGCSGAHVVVEFDGHVFTGDLVTNRYHSWIELGQLDEWQKRLQEIRQMDPEYVHPGRGASAGAELLERQEAYLKRVKELVLKAKPRGEPKESVLTALKEKIEAEYPEYDFAHFIEIGLPAVWAKYAKK